MPENWPQGALIVLGASEEQSPLCREARRRQIPTIAVDMRSDTPDFPFADATLKTSTRDTDAIADALAEVRPAGIVCGASDAALASWHALALRYGTTYVYPERTLAAGDRAAFHKIGLVVAAGASAADASSALDAAGALIRPVIRPAEETQ